MAMHILPRRFYLEEDVLGLSQALLGKVLVTNIQGQVTAGMIVETEAYRGIEDSASHAYNNRRTLRTETMYLEGGVAYIYLCYGMHHLFNVVTAPAGIPHAVLIRAVEPLEGITEMCKRRQLPCLQSNLTAGPGMLTQALGITKKWDGTLLTSDTIWIEERGVKVEKEDVLASPRVGIDYAKADRDLPWRFRLKNNTWTSKA
jgi:DNA-3-methyladenine glycosylase